MPKFKVSVTRTYHTYYDYEIEAKDKEEAQEIGADRSANTEGSLHLGDVISEAFPVEELLDATS